MSRRVGRAAAAASMADELREITVTLFRPTSSASSLGLGTWDLGLGLGLIDVDEDHPPAVCKVEKDSPAAKCQQIEVGDIITDINNEDVQKYTIKEVLKCLELAQNPVTLRLLRDPDIINKVHNQLKQKFSRELLHDTDPLLLQRQTPSSEMATKANSNRIKIAKCKSYTKTGDKVIKLSINAEFTLSTKKNQETHDMGENGSSNQFQKVNSNSVSSSSVENYRPNIAKQNSENASPVSPPKVSKYKHRSHSKNSLSSNFQQTISPTTSNHTNHEEITPSSNCTSSNSNILCPDNDFLTNPGDIVKTYLSDSDSIILARKPSTKKQTKNILCTFDTHKDYQIMKQIESPNKTKLDRSTENKKYDYHDKTINNNDNHYTPFIGFDFDNQYSSRFSKVVDIPSASRLAKHLFYLEGFKKNDMSYHLNKNDEYSKAVAEKYWAYFDFENMTIDTALRSVLNKINFTGKIKEEEKILATFSNKYLDCNPACSFSPNAFYSLNYAILQLNSHLHDPNVRSKVTCEEFIQSMTGLNDGTNFPQYLLKSMFEDIQHTSLEWANYYDLYQIPLINGCHENVSTQDLYKTGYLSRKYCLEPFRKKTLKGKRSWKMYSCELKNLLLHLNKCNSEFHDSPNVSGSHEVIFLLNGLATKATDYTKKPNVFRLVTADQSEFLFQTNDSKEFDSWIDSINFACARFSSPGLPKIDGNHKKFQRPLLPSAPTNFNLQEQLSEYENSYQKLNAELHKNQKPPLESGSALLQYHEDKEAYLHEELKRYEMYINALKSKMIQLPKYNSCSISMNEK